MLGGNHRPVLYLALKLVVLLTLMSRESYFFINLVLELYKIEPLNSEYAECVHFL